MTSFEKVRDVIVDQLGLNESEIELSTTTAELEMDSLDSIELIMAIEAEFGIDIDDNELEPITTVQGIVDLVTEKTS